jgi:Na+-transporting methylmalonyl-CoA/oxaloacetate decarboxylase gamma subunit
MDKWSFGLTLLIVGVGGTFLTLWILSMMMLLLKKAFPLTADDAGGEKKS